MTRECLKCGKQIPSRIIVNGKRKNLQRRKYCLDCSPFGEHNTRNLVLPPSEKDRTCKLCGRVIRVHQKCGYQCHSCWQKKKEVKRSDMIYQIVGEECWFCGYSEDRRILDFHHVDPSNKKFDVHLRNASNLAWERVEKEIRKCVLACCRCHREIEYGLIPSKKVLFVYRKEWNTR